MLLVFLPSLFMSLSTRFCISLTSHGLTSWSSTVTLSLPQYVSGFYASLQCSLSQINTGYLLLISVGGNKFDLDQWLFLATA